MNRIKTLILLAALFTFTLIPMVSASPRSVQVQDVCIWISDAYYADLDGDSYEDDIKILVEFALADIDPSRVDINLWVTLPSGTTYAFRISVYRPPAASTLQIDCIDMAQESGWYEIDMIASIFGTSSGRCQITDYFIFDPPTGGGPGLPTVTAYF